MKILIDKSSFENMISTLQAFLDKKDVSQITSHILIEAKDDKLILKATDYEIGLEMINSLVVIEEEGTATSNGKKLLDIIKRLKSDDLIMETKDEILKIKQGKSNFKLPMFDYREYPSFPNRDIDSKIELDNLEFLKSIKKSIPAIDSNNPKFELNGALIDIKESRINLVSTDTKRLSIVEIKHQSNENKELIIPKKALTEIQKIFSSDIEILSDDVNLIIKSENEVFFTKLINGKFPNYERIVPQETKYKIELPKREIIEAIKIVTSVSNEIKMIIKDNQMTFESLGDENSEAKTELELNLNTDANIEMGINSKYLTDFLSIIDTDTFTLELNENNTPFVVKSQSSKTIIMPIVI